MQGIKATNVPSEPRTFQVFFACQECFELSEETISIKKMHPALHDENSLSIFMMFKPFCCQYCGSDLFHIQSYNELP